MRKLFIRQPANSLLNKRERRLPTILQVEFFHQGEDCSTYSTNISEGGLFIQKQDGLRPGDRLNLRISLPNGLLHALGRVAWVHNHRHKIAIPGAGIQFVRMPLESRTTLQEFLTTFSG